MKLLLRNFHTRSVIMEIAMMKISNDCMSSSNKNYFLYMKVPVSTNNVLFI